MVGALAHTDHQSNERRNRPLRKPRQGRRPKILNPPTNPEPARVFATTPRSFFIHSPYFGHRSPSTVPAPTCHLAVGVGCNGGSMIVPSAAAQTSFASIS